jgi:hypothetical protein
MNRTLPSRPFTGFAALALIGALVAWDSARVGLPDLFRAPPPVALGSGLASSGAHCTAN